MPSSTGASLSHPACDANITHMCHTLRGRMRGLLADTSRGRLNQTVLHPNRQGFALLGEPQSMLLHTLQREQVKFFVTEPTTKNYISYARRRCGS
eukprot:COSAG01_NODE_623_length_14742_cov_22.391177_18_plen_95_part_00